MTAGTDATDRALLGVGPNASASAIAAAYRRKVREVHPDISREDDQAVHELMTSLADARRRLLNPGFDDHGIAGLGDTEHSAAETVDCTDLEPEDEPWFDPPIPGDVVSARTSRLTARLFAIALIAVTLILLVFSVIAFASPARSSPTPRRAHSCRRSTSVRSVRQHMQRERRTR